MTTRSDAASVSLAAMLKHAVVDAKDKVLGQLQDVVASLRGDQYPVVTGLVIGIRGGRMFVPVHDIVSLQKNQIHLEGVKSDWQPFQRRDGEVLLQQDVLGHRLLDVDHIALVKAYDVRLAAATEGWVVKGLDVHKHRWFQFGGHEHHPARDWHAFLLIGDPASRRTRRSSSRLRRLKPAHIADILEGASAQEQELLLAQIYADPELEADVFEELDDDQQSKLLKTRNDSDVADVLSRMRADDAADAIMDLPQDRRRKVLELLPQPQNERILALLGYHDATAGGLDGDGLSCPA